MPGSSPPLPRYRVRVAPSVLRWSRETAGLTTEDAASLLNVAAARLEAWESDDLGAAPPTVAQIRSMSEAYHRPVSIFLLAQPPPDQLLPTFARRLHGATVEEGSRHLRFAVRAACEQRESALRLAADLGEPPREPPHLVIDERDPEASATAIRASLAISRSEERRWAETGRSLLEWIDRLDGVGVMVTQFRYVDPEERRGFSIVERPFPVIALNEQDARTARLFTLLHELVHILLAETTASDHSEELCNAIAAATLMPSAGVRELLHPFAPSEWVASGLDLAAAFGVSREAAYRRMATLRMISNEQYQSIRQELLQEPRPPRQGGGPPYPTGEIRRVGRLYIDLVGSAYDRGTISLHEASRRLGVQGRFVEPLIAAASGRPA